MKKYILSILFIFIYSIGNCGTYYIDPSLNENGDGSIVSPYNSWNNITIVSNNEYLQKSGTIFNGYINIAGLENVKISTYNGKSKAILEGENNYTYGIYLLSTKNVEINNFEIRNYTDPCIKIIGSENYLIKNKFLHNAHYGVLVNAGKWGPYGIIDGNTISNVTGDGIGAWNLNPGILIKNNEISFFGNDGIDVLGSYNASIENNLVYNSTDFGIEIRNTSSGIKAGGNEGSGGSNNRVVNNIVYNVYNYGIYNRNAHSNIYIGNVCYKNGVNFSLTRKEGPANSYIENNHAYSPSYAAGMEYNVFIPNPADIIYMDNNRWIGGGVKIIDGMLYSDISEYKSFMFPFEQKTVFSQISKVRNVNINK